MLCKYGLILYTNFSKTRSDRDRNDHSLFFDGTDFHMTASSPSPSRKSNVLSGGVHPRWTLYRLLLIFILINLYTRSTVFATAQGGNGNFSIFSRLGVDFLVPVVHSVGWVSCPCSNGGAPENVFSYADLLQRFL